MVSRDPLINYVDKCIDILFKNFKELNDLVHTMDEKQVEQSNKINGIIEVGRNLEKRIQKLEGLE